MNISYDVDADAVYIKLVDSILSGDVYKTYLCDPEEIGGMVNIDLNHEGQILGIEILGARTLLTAEALGKV